MAMEEALVARLVAALGGTVGNRVSWFERQRGDGLPALTLNPVSPGRSYAHDGPDELDGPRVQIDCWAARADTVQALRRAVRAEMETAADVAGVRFYPAFVENDTWIGADEQDSGEPLFRVILDFQFYHEEL